MKAERLFVTIKGVKAGDASAIYFETIENRKIDWR